VDAASWVDGDVILASADEIASVFDDELWSYRSHQYSDLISSVRFDISSIMLVEKNFLTHRNQ
jgi:hypothetical protein